MRKVLWTLDETGSVPNVKTGAPGPVHVSPDFLALNPNGLVPVLLDGDMVLWESNVICRYRRSVPGAQTCCLTTPCAGPWSSSGWTGEATEFSNAWRYAFMAKVRQSPAHQDAALIEQGGKPGSVTASTSLAQQLERTQAPRRGPPSPWPTSRWGSRCTSGFCPVTRREPSVIRQYHERLCCVPLSFVTARTDSPTLAPARRLPGGTRGECPAAPPVSPAHTLPT